MTMELLKESARGAAPRGGEAAAVRGAVWDFLHGGGEGGADEVLALLGDECLKSAMFRTYVVVDVYLAARVFAEEMGVSQETFEQHCGSMDEAAGRTGTAEGAREYLLALMNRCAVWRRMYLRCGARVTENAKAYMDRHFCDEDISLDGVAAAVKMSPAYFSHLFKKEAGISFVGYITRLRMEMAKELMRCSPAKLAQVAARVGYRDAHYFSYLFKKYTGMPPGVYRAAHGRGADGGRGTSKNY